MIENAHVEVIYFGISGHENNTIEKIMERGNDIVDVRVSLINECVMVMYLHVMIEGDSAITRKICTVTDIEKPRRSLQELTVRGACSFAEEGGGRVPTSK